jgi:hypothetical protein
MVTSILPKKKNELTILIREDAQDIEFLSVFGKIEATVNCFRDLLTFIKLIRFLVNFQPISLFL